ncbi:MAG: phosphodiester glycosidase family protein [Verrucomicrobiales bacterium]
MDFSTLIPRAALCLFLSSCQPVPPAISPPPAPAPMLGKEEPSHPASRTLRESSSTPPPAPQESRPLARLQASRQSHGGKTFTLLSFEERRHELRLIDKAKGPDSSWTSAQDAARSEKALAAINGGYFTPEGHPLGLLSVKGQRRGGMNHSSLGSAFYLASPRAQLVSRDDFQQSPHSATEFLQSGPRLVWNGQALKGLSGDQERARSFLAWDGHHHWLIGHCESVSLRELARLLATQPFSGFHVEKALNLDGGRSSDLWISPSVPGGEFECRAWWNKPVRNYLILREKSE